MNIGIEITGILAGTLIAISMIFKTSTIKTTILLRLFNLLGSIVFVIYGILLPAVATAIVNLFLVVVNAYYLIVLIKERKKELEVKNK